MKVEIQQVDHPLAAARLTVMRDKRSDTGQFRQALQELSSMLVYEATRNFDVEVFPVETPLTTTEGRRLAKTPLLVPILRAGLGMADAARDLMPEAGVGFIGLARDESSHEPVLYMESLPADLRDRPVVVLDPMLATGGSLLQCLQLLTDRGADDLTVICVLASPEGIERIKNEGPSMRLVVAAIDDHLDEQAFIVPGLGDAGDRQFGAAR